MGGDHGGLCCCLGHHGWVERHCCGCVAMGQAGLLVTFTRMGASDSMGSQGVSVNMCVGEAVILDL